MKMFERYNGFPKGAIQTSDELKSLIVRAIQYDEQYVYAVAQLGRIETYAITSDSKYTVNTNIESSLCIGPAFNSVSCVHVYDDGHRHNYKILMGSYNVDNTDVCGCANRLFGNLSDANAYSNTLRDDAEYVEAVRQHVADCAIMHHSYGMYDYEYDDYGDTEAGRFRLRVAWQ